MTGILKYKPQMIIAFAVIAIVAIIYFVGRKAGKNASNNPWQAPLPGDLGSNANDAGVDWTKVRRISDDLFADLDKWDWNPFTFSRNVDIYVQFNSLSDTEFVAVYNDFNSRFSSEFKGKSLRTILQGEIGWGLGSFNSLRDSIENRFVRLKLV